jgi:hypothetical protein
MMTEGKIVHAQATGCNCIALVVPHWGKGAQPPILPPSCRRRRPLKSYGGSKKPADGRCGRLFARLGENRIESEVHLYLAFTPLLIPVYSRLLP